MVRQMSGYDYYAAHSRNRQSHYGFFYDRKVAYADETLGLHFPDFIQARTAPSCEYYGSVRSGVHARPPNVSRIVAVGRWR
jgi:hypothetical protein